MNAVNEKANERREIEYLFPWHAAGTLSRHDAERVELALSRDPELVRRFALVQEELNEAIRLNESLGAPSTRALEKLMTAIDAEPARRRGFSFDLGERLATFLSGFSPRTLAWSAVAAALAIVLQAGLIAGVLIRSDTGQNYQTASAPAQVETEKGTFVLVRFAPSANAEEITRFLNANAATIVEGPKAGMYKLRLAASSKEQLARVVRSMQEDKVVGFAAPTD
jgi:hypothetical protein